VLADAAVLIALALVAVEAGRLLAGLRRAVRVNRALHELRRPLQSISLSLTGSVPDVRSAEACLEQARLALAELDAVVNHRGLSPRLVRTAVGEVAGALESRWRPRGIRVTATEPGRAIDADPGRLAAALDNLVANAFEHGAGPVEVRALSSAGAVRFEVQDDGGDRSASRAENDPRHGHGLRVAGEVAATHGGTLVPPRRTARGTIAAISLPAAATSE
jgi:two-component system osmolarity sensor histidine kinase EnvZ